MAQLYFYYSAMNAGKTTRLLQAAFNYEERGLSTLCFLPEIVFQRTQKNFITSRIGLQKEAHIFTKDLDLVQYIRNIEQKNERSIACVFVDEVQFLKKGDIEKLCRVVDILKIPVLAYGLRSDFQGELFEGSQWLLAWADSLIEVKTVCFCGKKAVMTARVDLEGHPLVEGPQVLGSWESTYTSLCRFHYKKLLEENKHLLEDIREKFVRL